MASHKLLALRDDITLFHPSAVALHEAGPYAIVEVGYCDGCAYHVFVDGGYTGRKADTIEAALLMAMAIKHNGRKEGRHLAKAAGRVLGL